jgi:hypothetical protein
MNSKWFKEDRALPKHEQAEAVEATKQTLLNSRLMHDRLERILNDEIEESYRLEENFDDPWWERKHVAAISRRKALREILKLIDFTKGG